MCIRDSVWKGERLYNERIYFDGRGVKDIFVDDRHANVRPGRPGPVSYTHLDLYKRQDKKRMNMGHCCCGAHSCTTENKKNASTDVYKRQVMEKAAQLLNAMHVPFEMNALSAHRTPEAVEEFAKNARNRGIKVIIAAAGMAAALPGVIAANTTLPVIGVPVKGSVLDGVDALYSIIQMPPGIPVATVAINGAMNAAILAIQMLALSDEKLAEAFAAYKAGLKKKIVKANEELKEVKFEYKTN